MDKSFGIAMGIISFVLSVLIFFIGLTQNKVKVQSNASYSSSVDARKQLEELYSKTTPSAFSVQRNFKLYNFDGKLIFRPIHFFLPHKVLPTLFFAKHPEIEQIIVNKISKSDVLALGAYLRGLTETMSIDLGYFTQEQAYPVDNYAPMKEMAAAFNVERFEVSNTKIFVFTFPKPILIPEVYFTALSVDSIGTRRYFTLENAGMKRFFSFGERTADGTYKFLKFLNDATQNTFLKAIEEKL